MRTTKNKNQGKSTAYGSSTARRTTKNRKQTTKSRAKKSKILFTCKVFGKKVTVRSKQVLVALCVIVLLIGGFSVGSRISGMYSIPLSSGNYEIKGVDVSSYQGNVDFKMLYEQNIAFAYIKATEGSQHVDKRFEENWKKVRRTKMHFGAYHFMSFDSPAKTQAENFLKTVKHRRDMMPPVIDLETYGKYSSNHPSREHVQSILTPLSDRIEKETGMKPIIYTTPYLYRQYVEGSYSNDIWIADEYLSQPLADGKYWTFCQYSYSGVLKGYSGGVKHIDLDVFRGKRSDFYKYCY